MSPENQDALRCAEVLMYLPAADAKGHAYLSDSSAHIRRLVAENERLQKLCDERGSNEARMFLRCRELSDQVAALGAKGESATALVQQMLEALRNGGSVCSSVSTSHDRRIRRDGCTLYAQTEEWCKWAEDEIRPQIIAAITAASEWLAPKNNTIKENS